MSDYKLHILNKIIEKTKLTEQKREDLSIINILALIQHASILQRKTIIIMNQSFDKKLHMYIAPKQWNLYKN